MMMAVAASVGLRSFSRSLCSVASRHADNFQKIVGQGNVLTDADDLAPFNHDWTAQIEGGNTGICCGAIPIGDDLVISLSRMNEVTSFHRDTGIVVAQTGAILQNVMETVDKEHHMIPWDLGARGSCQIGGNLATAAGGINFLKFGPIAGNILGLEVVLPNGEILDTVSLLRKDNTGYNLPGLFIGSEGTLGVITKAAIQCYPKPSQTATAFLGVRTYADCLKIMRHTRQSLSNYLYAFELLDEDTVSCVEEHYGLSPPLASRYPFYLMVRVGGSNGGGWVQDALVECLTSDRIGDHIADAVISESGEQERIREEKLVESFSRDGHAIMLDLSLPTQHFYEVIEATRAHLAEFVDNGTVKRVTGFGHFVDGNVHVNVTMPKKSDAVRKKLIPWIYEWTSAKSGSFSAEHGVGFAKRQYLPLRKSRVAIDTMKAVKNALDPHGIMNPGKIFL